MRWELSEEQVMFQESLRGWLERAAPPAKVRAWQDSGDPADYEQALVADGWLGVGTPEESGGQGGGLIELALAAEEFARAAAPSSAWLATVLAVPALAGQPDVLTAVLDKGSFAALVLPADALPGDSTPGLQSDGDTVTGSVSGVLGADRAGALVVPVADGAGLRLVLVDAAADGVTTTSRILLDRSRSVADVVLDHVPATPLDVAAEQVLADAALRAAVVVAADALGVMARMLELAVEYSLQREQFGVVIGSFQAVKHAAAGMLVAVESARSIVYYAAASVDEGSGERAVLAAAAKSQVTAEAGRSADTALTTHGAIGYTWEYDLQLLYKRAKLDGFLFGSPSVWNERLAAALPLLPS